MALITCPHCGQSVSDSAPKCIHCGFELSVQPKNFYNLPLPRQIELENEFYSFHRDYALKSLKYVHLKTAKAVLIIICAFFPLSLGILCIILQLAFNEGGDDTNIPLIIGVVFFIVTGIQVLLGGIKIINCKKLKMKQLLIRAEFEAWLKEKHDISITWDFTNKEYYDYKIIKKGIK